jgi:hypothetical protein
MARKQPQNSKRITNPTIGADIEVFLQNINSGEIISAEGIIKGTKEEPFHFDEFENHFATSLDNVMAEFNIPPAKDAQRFANNILYAMGWINGFIPENVKTLVQPAAHVNYSYLQTDNAKVFGCEPDYNAWLMGEENGKPCVTGNLRSCGGHIHIGYDNPDISTSMELIRAMDIFIGLPSVLQEPDNERKLLYGKAGAFRSKSYGAEYRTVSNYYVDKKELMEWVFNNTMQAIEFVNNRNILTREQGEGIIHAINTADKTLAKDICEYFGVKLAA